MTVLLLATPLTSPLAVLSAAIKVVSVSGREGKG
jgi:hypothetical protein